jgi:AhpD family alkylhydroperoxidase
MACVVFIDKSYAAAVPSVGVATESIANEGFIALRSLFASSSLSGVEREVIAMTVAFDNQCAYCMAAHSTAAKRYGASEDVLSAVRAGELPSDPRLAALSSLTHQVVRKRGQISAENISAFLDAGFTQSQLLELLIGVSMTTLASYMYHIAGTPPDAAFQPQAWMAPA